jgi:hypothetical protein
VFIQPIHIGFGAGFDHVGGSAASHHALAALLQPHGNFADGLGAAGHRANIVARQRGGALRDGGNGLVDRVHGPIADRRAFPGFAFDADADRSCGNGGCAAIDVHVLEMIGVGNRMNFIVEDGDQILVEDFLLLIGHRQESLVRLIELFLR